MTIHHEPATFRQAVPLGNRLLGLDVGTKTIGLAVSDGMAMVASPVTTIRRVKFTADVEELARIMRDRQIGGLVVGLPLNMDGSDSPRTQSIRDFARNLLERTGQLGGEPEILLWDERLSTVAVENAMIREGDLSRKKRAKKVDQLAATWILQGALDALGRAMV